MLENSVTLQINVAPSDLKHLKWILPHQLKQLGNQVSEVLLTYDRPATAGSEKSRSSDELIEFCETLKPNFPHLTLHEVSLEREDLQSVGDEFYGGSLPPIKDHRGRPIFAYFFGLARSKGQYVLHLDSDMMFGGGSQVWIAEALQILQSDPDVLACSPFPGPPLPEIGLKPELHLENYGNLEINLPEKYAHFSLAYAFRHISTRVFLLDRLKFQKKVGALQPKRPIFRQYLRALMHGHPHNEFAEITFSRAMMASGSKRVDLLGSGPGLWSIHPPYRSEGFYSSLPELIRRIEKGDVPEGQLGDYDINSSFFDWGDSAQKTSRSSILRQFAERVLRR